jgi:hypothetical protein
MISPLAIAMSSPSLPHYKEVEILLQQVDKFADECPICFDKACFAVNNALKRANIIACGHMLHVECIQSMKIIASNEHKIKSELWKKLLSTYVKKCPLCSQEFTWSRI